MKRKNKLEIKISNDSSFVLLIFGISKFQNIGRSTFGCSKDRPLPKAHDMRYQLLHRVTKHD